MTRLAENVNAVVFVVGLAMVTNGVARLSVAASWIVAGLVLMALGVSPYLRKGKG